MKVLDTKTLNGKKMFLIEEPTKLFAEKGVKAEPVYYGGELPEVTITAKRQKSIKDFVKRYSKKIGDEYSGSLEGSLFAAPIMSILGLPQAAATYALSKNNELKPSKALNIDSKKSPIKAMAADIVLDPINLLGVGAGLKGLKNLNPNEIKTLQKAYKLNPWAFKPNPEAYYRTLGKEGIDDAFNSGVIRPKQTSNIYSPELGKRVDVNVPEFPEGSYFNKSGLYSNNKIYNPDYIAEVVGKDNLFTYPERIVFNENIRVAPNNIPIEEANFYKKDWLKGYKEVPKPKENFKSEIEWGKWNKEIPDNKALMQEYNAIEQTSKNNGTWMKNPDGSAFQGTPEQFVQQNSENFKKAFPEYHGEILNHNTNAELNTIDESFFNKGAGDTGYYGKGTYAHPKKEYTKMYGKNNYELYLNSKNKGFLDKSNIDDAEYFKRSDDEILQHNLPEYENKLINYELDPSRYYDNAKEKWLNKLNEQVKAGKISRDKLDEFTSLHNPKNGEVVIPFNNRIKSAIGNNGMFDMSNPNIYKTLFGGLTIGTLGKKTMEKKEFGGKILNTKIENGKKYFLINE